MAQPHDVIYVISSDEEEDDDDLGESLRRLFLIDTLQRNEKKQSIEKFVVEEVDLDLDSDSEGDCEVLDLDECMILDADPDNSPVQLTANEDHGSDDEMLVIAEKGQIACRDYPHARHLCVTFPFGTSPHQKYCDLCHCYVCDAQAPCVNWGTGGSVSDHCHATEKEGMWIIQRQSSKQVKVAQKSACDQRTTTSANEPSMHSVDVQLREFLQALRLNSSLSDVHGGR